MGGDRDREDRDELIPSSATSTTDHPASSPSSSQPMASSKQKSGVSVAESSGSKAMECEGREETRRQSGSETHHEEFHPADEPNVQADRGKEASAPVGAAPPFTKQSSASSLTSSTQKLTQLPTKIVHKVVEKIQATTSSITGAGTGSSATSPTAKEAPTTTDGGEGWSQTPHSIYL